MERPLTDPLWPPLNLMKAGWFVRVGHPFQLLPFCKTPAKVYVHYVPIIKVSRNACEVHHNSCLTPFHQYTVHIFYILSFTWKSWGSAFPLITLYLPSTFWLAYSGMASTASSQTHPISFTNASLVQSKAFNWWLFCSTSLKVRELSRRPSSRCTFSSSWYGMFDTNMINALPRVTHNDYAHIQWYNVSLWQQMFNDTHHFIHYSKAILGLNKQV